MGLYPSLIVMQLNVQLTQSAPKNTLTGLRIQPALRSLDLFSRVDYCANSIPGWREYTRSITASAELLIPIEDFRS